MHSGLTVMDIVYNPSRTKLLKEAEKAGAEWPDSHQATHWLEECSVCGSYAQVCDVGDYDWPDKQSRGIRD